jgi:hypothetical protein
MKKYSIKSTTMVSEGNLILTQSSNSNTFNLIIDMIITFRINEYGKLSNPIKQVNKI